MASVFVTDPIFSDIAASLMNGWQCKHVRIIEQALDGLKTE